MPCTINVAALVHHLGGPLEVSRQLDARHITIRQVPAIEAWIRRNSIPSNALAELMVLADKLQRSVDLRDYITTTYINPAGGSQSVATLTPPDPPEPPEPPAQGRLSPAW